MEFKIYADDLDGVCRVLDEFIKIAEEEFNKSRVMKVWRKIEKRVKIKTPSLIMFYEKRSDHVSFNVSGTYFIKVGGLSNKLKGYLMKSFEAKNVKVDRIEFVEEAPSLHQGIKKNEEHEGRESKEEVGKDTKKG